MKHKITRVFVIGCMMTMFMSTAAMASQGYNFHLVAQQSKMTRVVEKQSNGLAYVERTGPSGASTTVTVNMCNSNGTKKSASGNIKGIGHVWLSYSGYGTSSGDYLACMVTNPVSTNGGRSIDATGTFTP